MFAKVAILFAALAAVNASVLLGHSALVNTGVSARSQTQDAYGNYAFGYDIKDGLGATNSRSERPSSCSRRAPVVNHVAPAAAVIGHAASYAAPLAVAAPALAAPVAYGGVLGHGAAIAAPVAYGGVIGHGAALGTPLGLGYGLGYGKALIH
ncbi:hypothetical protein HNY73_009182 [Argiope bruennichi]|uniref:Uncharacterized protein n=1 Tax=Argiope bruennichi TaxID=94029 RepID=A0A8T0FB66_ARGBR|nr:hypothetical protein HNY73_009182 [Argiope bruennichi]